MNEGVGLGGSPLLLDTHVWIWVIEGTTGVLAPSVVTAVEEASEAGAVRVAAITVWEVGMLEAKGRLRLALGIEEWVRRALTAPGVQLVPLTPDIATASTRLPGNPAGDPVDRMLVATARQTGTTLVTCDERILAYGASGRVAVMDATP